MRELKPAFYAAAVGHVYEAALDPRRWDDVLDLIETVYPDARIAFFAHRKGRPSPAFSFRKNFSDDDLRAYSDYYVKNSPFIERLDRGFIGTPQYSEVLIGDNELIKTEYYNDFMRARRLGHYATGILLERDSRGMTAISIADRKDDLDRRRHQMRLLGVLLPHLQRAIQLHRVVDRERAAATATQTLFDRWTHAAFVLDASGKMVSMNTAAARLLERENCLWLDRGGSLRSVDGDNGNALETAVRKHSQLCDKLDVGACGSADASFALRRTPPAPPLQAMAWPLPFIDRHTEFGDERGRVLVIVFDPHTQRTTVAWMARQYGLSPGEAKLTEAIVNGTPLTEAAEQLGIQQSTARTRLKIIQAKTGCGRQVDLVRLALAAPAIRQD
jgi:DNA-binding CsgD family transcriptional regulator/PAS domain-containing protein